MMFSMEDLERGYKHCECNLRFVLTSGTDYPPESWVKCGVCDSFVVDDAIVTKLEGK